MRLESGACEFRKRSLVELILEIDIAVADQTFRDQQIVRLIALRPGRARHVAADKKEKRE